MALKITDMHTLDQIKMTDQCRSDNLFLPMRNKFNPNGILEQLYFALSQFSLHSLLMETFLA